MAKPERKICQATVKTNGPDLCRCQTKQHGGKLSLFLSVPWSWNHLRGQTSTSVDKPHMIITTSSQGPVWLHFPWQCFWFQIWLAITFARHNNSRPWHIKSRTSKRVQRYSWKNDQLKTVYVQFCFPLDLCSASRTA